MIVTKGATDVTTYVMMVDSSAGTPETGLTITNIDLQYTRMREAPAAKVDATALAATNSAHSDNKAIEIDGTSSPGLYRVDWPDAAFATGADKVILSVTCSGCAPAYIHVDLVNYNTQDGVRLGLTALPNAAADAAGGLPISDAGGLDMDAILSRIGTPSNLGGGASLSANLSDIEAQTDDIGVAGAGLTAVPWNSAWDAEVESEANDALIAQNLDHLVKSAVDTDFATTVHANSVIGHVADNGAGFDRTTDSLEAIRDRGDAAWTTATGFSTHTAADVWAVATRALTVIDEDSTTLDLDATIRAAVGLAAADLDTQLSTIDNFLDTEIADILAAVDTEVAAIKAKTDQLTFTNANQVDVTVLQIANNAIAAAAIAADAGNELADAFLDRNMATGTDSGNNTDVRTVRQALRLLRNKVSIAAGTATITKEDDSTSSWTAAVTTTAGNPISAIDPGGP